MPEDDNLLEDAAFYDGLEEDPGKPFLPLNLPRWATGQTEADKAESELVPPPAPPPAPRLLTPEEFMRKYNLPRPGRT
jgi:hypothetical protein